MELKSYSYTLEAIRSKKDSDRGYNSTYNISWLSFTCSDGFQGRYGRTINEGNWNKDFVGFKILGIKDIEKELPEFFLIAKTFKAKVYQNMIICNDKPHAWFMFKLFRHVMTQIGVKVLNILYELLKEGKYNPLTALIVATDACFYDKNFQWGVRRSLIEGRYIFIGTNRIKFLNNRSNDTRVQNILLMSLCSLKSIDTFYRLIYMQQSIGSSFKINRPDINISLHKYNTGTYSFSYDTHNLNGSYWGKISNEAIKEYKRYKKFLINKEYDKAIKMVPELNFWEFWQC